MGRPSGFGRPKHERRHRRDERGPGDAGRPVPADVARHLAAAGGEADEHDGAEVEGLDQRGEVIGVGVHLVAVPRLARANVTSAVVRDAAIAANGSPRLGTAVEPGARGGRGPGREQRPDEGEVQFVRDEA